MKRSTASKSSPARRKRMPPVQMGGHAATSHLVPALLPPHRKITNSKLAAVTALFFGCDTRRVSQCAGALPIKFIPAGGARLLVSRNHSIWQRRFENFKFYLNTCFSLSKKTSFPFTSTLLNKFVSCSIFVYFRMKTAFWGYSGKSH